MQLIQKSRIQSIDLLRGLAMIIMALDHCRDLLSQDSMIDHDPLDFATTTPALFLTRWITHFCAPVFVMLSGTGIFLYGNKGRTKKQVAFFLFTRGCWLIFAEIFIVGPLWEFHFSLIYLQVIWAIGVCMVLLAGLQFLPYRILLVLGLLIVFGHNSLDQISIEGSRLGSFFWSALHKEQSYLLSKHFMVAIHYPFLPWLGLMILGYCMGKLYVPEASPVFRRWFLRITGIAAVLLFVVLRAPNLYGDMHHWVSQKTALFTVLDFINTTKYPPSLLYILMTIGPALIFLSVAESLSGKWVRIVTVFGKTPFFYYVLHVALIHSLAWAGFFLGGHGWEELDFDHFRDGSLPFGFGYSLPVVYGVWVVVIFILYFPCRWYSTFKSTHRYWWLSYI